MYYRPYLSSMFRQDRRSTYSSPVCTASLHKLAAGRKLAATHLNVSNRQICGCTGFKSGSYNKSYYNTVDHSRMIQAFTFIEISKYDDDSQLMTRGQLKQGSSKVTCGGGPVHTHMYLFGESPIHAHPHYSPAACKVRCICCCQ